MITLLRLALLTLPLLLGPVLADETPAPATLPSPPAPPVTEPASPHELEIYGEADATCREWGNGCQVCRRTGEHEWACSTAGIACVPEPVTCRGR